MLKKIENTKYKVLFITGICCDVSTQKKQPELYSW